MQDYKVFLIDPIAMTDADLEHLNSSLREVLSYIKYQHDQEQMQRLLQEDQRFSELERNAALVIQATPKTELNIKPNVEVVDMCEAIRQMMESSKACYRVCSKVFSKVCSKVCSRADYKAGRKGFSKAAARCSSKSRGIC